MLWPQHPLIGLHPTLRGGGDCRPRFTDEATRLSQVRRLPKAGSKAGSGSLLARLGRRLPGTGNGSLGLGYKGTGMEM